MSTGWFNNLADAEAYFTTDRLVTTAWDDLSTDALKTKAVIQGYNRIFYNPQYNVPSYADATAAQLVILKKVNGEMAYYLAVHLAAEDQRKGLQAQAVTDAGVVKEKYHKDLLDEVPVPAMVEALLDEFDELGETTVILPIDRDENEDLDTDVVGEG